MLTSFQMSTAAYTDEYGTLYCADCAPAYYTRPVSHYELGEYASRVADYTDGEHVENCSCTYEQNCDHCQNTLEDEYIDDDCEDKRDEGAKA